MPRAKRTDGKPPRTKRLDRPSAKRDAKVAAGVTLLFDHGSGKGRHTVSLNEDVLYDMAKTHASYDMLAEIFGCSSAHIQQTYKELVEKARAETKKNLLAAQFMTAINDRNPTMQIWLGKQYLEQKDVSRTEHTGPDGKPVATENQNYNRAVAYIPDNGRDTGPAESADAKV